MRHCRRLCLFTLPLIPVHAALATCPANNTNSILLINSGNTNNTSSHTNMSNTLTVTDTFDTICIGENAHLQAEDTISSSTLSNPFRAINAINRNNDETTITNYGSISGTAGTSSVGISADRDSPATITTNSGTISGNSGTQYGIGIYGSLK